MDKKSLTGFPAFFVSIFLLSFLAMADENGTPAHKVLKSGMTMQLNQALTIEPQQARAYLQNGSIVRENDVDEYSPSCSVLSYKVQSSNQSVAPDSFEITRVKGYAEYVQSHFPVLASRDISGLQLAVFGETPMGTKFNLHLEIKSAKNPNIKQLQCYVVRQPNSEHDLTMTDLKQALGNIITLNAS